MQRVVGLEVEVAGDDRCRRAQMRVERSARRIDDRSRRRVTVPLGVDRAQRLDLRAALLLRVVLEMRGDDADLAERRGDDRLDRDSRHPVHAGIDRRRQQMPVDLAHREPRQDHVAEAPAPGALRRMIDGDSGRGGIARKQRRQRSELVVIRVAGEPRIRKIVGDLLQAQHVEVGERARFRDDPLRVDTSVDAAAPLDIPGDEIHLRSICLPITR